MHKITDYGLSQNPAMTVQTANALTELDKAVQGVAQQQNARAVIAGGSLRDVIFGIMPNDYDVFVDLGIEDPDEREDAATLFTDLLSETRALPWESFYKHQPQGPDDYQHKIGSLSVYEMPHVGLAGPTTQLIFKSFASPEALLGGFDYDLVKVYWDEGVVGTEEFNTALATRTVNFNDQNAFRRYQDWQRQFSTRIEFKEVIAGVERPHPVIKTKAPKSSASLFAGFEQRGNLGDHMQQNQQMMEEELERLLAAGAIRQNEF